MKTVPARKCITLPTGRQVTLGTYVKSWKKLLTMPPDTDVANWEWYPMTAAEILNRISAGVLDRINIRGRESALRCPRRDVPRRSEAPRNISARSPQRSDPTPDRLLRALRRKFALGHITLECRWCGSPLRHYELHHNRFCDPGCRQSYCS